MKSRGFPGGKRSPPGDSGGVPPGNPLDMDISAARKLGDWGLGTFWAMVGGRRPAAVHQPFPRQSSKLIPIPTKPKSALSYVPETQPEQKSALEDFDCM